MLALVLAQDELGRLAEFDLGGLQHGLLPVELGFERDQLVNVDAVQRPTVG